MMPTPLDLGWACLVYTGVQIVLRVLGFCSQDTYNLLQMAPSHLPAFGVPNTQAL